MMHLSLLFTICNVILYCHIAKLNFIFFHNGGMIAFGLIRFWRNNTVMNKFQAMAQIMMLLNEDGLLKPGTRVYKIVRKMISDKIDRLGPDAALAQVMDRKAHLLHQISGLPEGN